MLNKAEVTKGLWPSYGILTNMDCNLNCSYCFEKAKEQKVNNAESFESFLNALYKQDYVDKRKPLTEPAIIDAIGGESFLHPEIIDSLCETAKELDARYGVQAPFILSVSTNGTLLTRPDVQRVLTKWKDHINLGFSIDGTKENHDACRVDYAGRGSYDQAVAGFRWAQTILPSCRISVKATFCHATIERYAESVINLIELGFRTISANTVYEEVWNQEDAVICAAQLITVADYLVEHHLLEKVHVQQLNQTGTDPRYFNPYITKDQNWCGSCKYMRCLGFNNAVYGCHRFATMIDPIHLGKMNSGEITITNEKLLQDVTEQYQRWPQECRKCAISGYCPSCSVIAYEYHREHPEKYFERQPQCGWTVAVVGARVYLSDKLQEQGLQS